MSSLDILIAEDSHAFRKLYQDVLEKRGHNVIVTRDGAECVYEFINQFTRNNDKKHTPFDLVILDYDLPRRNGIKVTEEILEMCPHQRIMFVTAFSKDVLDKLRVFRKEKKFELLEKPFNIPILIRQVETLPVYRWNIKKIRGFKTWDQSRGLSEYV